MTFLWPALFLIIFAFVLIGAAFGAKFFETRRRQQVTRVLSAIDRSPAVTSRTIDILEKGEGSPGPLGRYLSRFGLHRFLEQRLRGANLGWRPEMLAGLTLVAAAAGALFGLRFHALVYRDLSIVACAVAAGSLPYVFVVRRRRRRLRDFEQQFPEVLDFIARAVKAGHAFSVSLELLAAESPEPSRTEFRHVFHEMTLGAPMERALNGLVHRVPLVDVRFFVSTVLLQRETGGNLAEILIKLAYIIRERFRIKGQVRAAAAHGRITATVLTTMPILLAVALSVVAPDYLASMARDPDGKIMILCALVGQVLGYWFMHRIVNIKV